MPVFLPPWTQLRPFSPEILLILSLAVVLLVPMFAPSTRRLTIALVAFLGVGTALVALLAVNHTTDPAQYSTLAHSAFGGMLVLDPFAWFCKLILLIFALLIIALWGMANDNAQPDGPEFFLLLISAVTGMCLMVSTSNLLMIFLAIEMASMPSYVLAGFRKTQRPGAEAALKYVLFGAVCSSLMLYGMSLLYGLAGTLNLPAIANTALTAPGSNVLLILGVVGMLIGIGFKISMVPVHFWCPDVFEGASIDVAAFLSVASKGAGLALLLRVLLSLLDPISTTRPHLLWVSGVLAIVGAITCFWGNLSAYSQTNIKRLLAYSSIAHAGYMLLGLAVLGVSSNEVSIPAGEALLVYLLLYLFMNAGAFTAAAAVKQLTGSETLEGYTGLGTRAPMLAFAMLIFLCSLIGIPMTVGFAAKLKIFQVLFNTHHWVAMLGIAVLAVNTVLAAFYYFRIIRQMYLVATDRPRMMEFIPATLLALLLVVPNVGLFVAYNWVDRSVQTFAQVHAERAEAQTAATVGK